MKKLINDTLKNKDGDWDKQSLTFFVSATVTVASGIALITLSYALGLTSNPTAENVFVTFAGLTGALSGIDIWKRKVTRKTEYQQQEHQQHEHQGNYQGPYQDNQYNGQ